MKIRRKNSSVPKLILLWLCTCTYSSICEEQNRSGIQSAKSIDNPVREVRRVLATKISIQTLKEGAEVYTDRQVTVDKVPQELAEYTLIAGMSELRWAKQEGLCFVLERPAVVYVGIHSQIKNPPEWLTKNFEKTSLKIGAYQHATRYPARPEAKWDFIMWRRSFPAGRVELGPNRNEALPYITVVEKGITPEKVEYSGPITGDILGFVKEGGRAYLDRSYTLKDIPPRLIEKTFVFMSQAYALENGEYSGTHLRVPWIDVAGRELLLARDATVYIAYDATSTSVPDWMVKAGFKKTDMTLKISNIKVYDDRTMAIYSKDFKKDERVWLGPNQGEGFSGWPLQYLVIVDAHN
jgi:hypothetical protein